MAGAIDLETSRYKSNTQLLLEESRAARDSAELANAQPVMIGLASHVHTCWQEARTAKEYITGRLLSAQRARAGQYDPSVLVEIRKFGGSEEYARITANKCRIAEAWLRDVFIGQTEKPWTLNPTPDPELPEDSISNINAQISMEFAAAFAQSGMPTPPAMAAERTKQLKSAEQERLREESRETAGRMERKMYDQMVQGGWVGAMGDFISDLVTFPAAHFKSPILRRRPTMKWDNSSGRFTPVVTDSIVMEFERVDPFRCFPSPGSVSPQEGYFIEMVSLSRGDLHSLIGVEGFDEPSIRAVLDEYGRGGLMDWTNQVHLDSRSSVNGEMPKVSGSPNVTIDALEYHGPVQGRQLVEWGMSVAEITDPDADYEACVWLIGRWVIKAQLNYDPLGRRPYYKTSYEELPGSYWGLGLVDILSDVQGITNAGIRAMVNNLAMCAGPQVGVNVERLPPGEDLTTVTPFKIWQFNESQTGSNTKAIEFFQPQSQVGEILSVVGKMYEFADDFSMIPRIWQGNASAGGAGRTASGLSMLMDAANKGLKGVVSNIDVKIMTPSLEAQFNHNMIYDPDESIKGDCKPLARGAISLMQLESLQLRRNEFLVATNNPVDNQIVGLEGRSEILREAAKGLDMDVDRIIPIRGTLNQPTPAAVPGASQSPAGPSKEQLDNGAAVTDNFSPNSMTPQ